MFICMKPSWNEFEFWFISAKIGFKNIYQKNCRSHEITSWLKNKIYENIIFFFHLLMHCLCNIITNILSFCVTFIKYYEKQLFKQNQHNTHKIWFIISYLHISISCYNGISFHGNWKITVCLWMAKIAYKIRSSIKVYF